MSKKTPKFGIEGDISRLSFEYFTDNARGCGKTNRLDPTRFNGLCPLHGLAEVRLTGQLRDGGVYIHCEEGCVVDDIDKELFRRFYSHYPLEAAGFLLGLLAERRSEQ